MSSTPGSRKSSRLNGPQDDPNAIRTAPPDNNGASGLCNDLRRLNINAVVYRPPPPPPTMLFQVMRIWPRW